MAKSSEWDVEKLKADIAKYTEMRDNLISTVKKMEQAKQSADETLRNVANEDNVWRDRCLRQQEENSRLQRQLEAHQKDVKELKTQTEEEVSGQVLEAGQSNLEGMSDVALRQLLKKLEKDKTEMEWKLKEYGWRLDQASAALSRAREERASISTQIKQAVAKMKDIQKTEGEHEGIRTEGTRNQSFPH